MYRDEATLLDIVGAAKRAEKFLANQSKDDFLRDEKSQSAVLYQLLVVGEAAKRLSDECKARHGEIPWKLMAGMRDHLIHAYDAVDWDEVWNTVVKDIPVLLSQIEPLISQRPQDE